MTPGTLTMVDVASIKMNKDWPYRKDAGHLNGLATSMNGPNGQLQPIGLDRAGNLIWGFRRLQAAKSLGWSTILARIVDLDDPLVAMKEENDGRMGLSPSELTALMRAIEVNERKKAQERMAEGPRGRCGNISTPSQFPGESGKTRDKVAENFGLSGKTYEAMKTVADKGTLALKEAVDAGTVSVSDGAKVATEPPKVQNQAVKHVKEGKAKTAAGAARSKAGKPIFDDRIIGSLIGKLASELHKRAKARGEENTDGYRNIRQCWENLNASWKRWQGS